MTRREGESVHLEGLPAPLQVRRERRARRLRLRVDVRDGSPVLVMPPRASLRQGLAFAAAHAGWLRARIAALPPRIALAAGTTLPLEGVPHRLAQGEGWRSVTIEDGTILVGDPPGDFARLLLAWLKRRARNAIVARATLLAERLGRPFGRITLRDPHSRWGSCSRKGDLSFSWRLILAPPSVLDYVVAHEMAHLVEMNHSAAFWKIVAGLAPDHAEAQAWLARHGNDLHRIG